MEIIGIFFYWMLGDNYWLIKFWDEFDILGFGLYLYLFLLKLIFIGYFLFGKFFGIFMINLKMLFW